MSTHKDDEKEHEPLTDDDARMTKLLALADRRWKIDNAVTRCIAAQSQISGAIETLESIGDALSDGAGALRGGLAEVSRAVRVLGRMRSDCHRAIARYSRRRTVR